MTVACIVATFPSFSEQFILREWQAMSEAGTRVLILPLRYDGVCAEGGDVEWRRGGPILGSGGRPGRAGALLRLLTQHPLRLVCTVSEALWANRHAPVRQRHVLRHIPTVAWFAHAVARHGVRHIHAHFLHVTADVAAMTAALTGLPFSISAHARDIHTLPRRARLHNLQKARFIAVCTRDGEQVLRQRIPDLRPPVLFAPHGLAPDEWTPDPAARRDPLLLLAAGRFVEKKGFGVLIEACRILACSGETFRCRIAGAGPLRPSLLAAVAAARLDERVDIEDIQESHGLWQRYRQAAMLVVPSVQAGDGDRDGLPNVILEAQACGTPVVASAIGGIPEFVTPEHNGLLVPPNRPDELAEAIRRLLHDPETAARMGADGRKKVEQTRDIRHTVLPLLHAFGATLGDTQT